MSERERRVVFVLLAHYVGGAEEYVARLVEGLPAGWRATVAVSDPGVRAWCAARVRGAHAAVVDLRVTPRLRAPWSWGVFARLLRDASPDLVHLNAPSTYDSGVEAAALLAHRAGARVVRTDHIASLPPSRRRSAITRWSTRWVDRVITVCEANRAALAARGVPAAKIAVVLNGTPVSEPATAAARAAVRAHEGIARDTAWVVCVGALKERKDPLLLVDAVAHARAAGAPVALSLVGEGELDEALRERAATHGIAPWVTLTGQRGDVRELLDASDIFVFSSHREGLPFAVLEAMAAGRAVIATAVDGIPEALDGGRCGVLVPPGDVESLTRALCELAGDAARRAALGAAARERVLAQFTQEAMVRDTLAVYDAVCGGER